MNIVLVVGERPEQARALAERLGIHGLESIPCARDWKLAVRSLTSHNVSLIVLDVDPTEQSMDFFKLMRDITEVPVLARGSATHAESVVWYLDNGAADYVTRTLPAGIVAAKIQSLLRTVHPARQRRGAIAVGNLAIDADNYRVTRSGRPISLTPIEFRLLRVLAENAGRACSHDELLEQVWGEDFKDCSHYLRLYIGYLRNKLEANPRRPKMLLTEWGYGYRLMEVEAKTGSLRGRTAMRAAATG